MIISKLLDLPWEDKAVKLIAFYADNKKAVKKPAVLVLPGGAYQVCAPAEGAPVAERFAKMGYAAFLLNYSVASTGGRHALFPKPLREVARAVAYLRENAAALGLDPERVVIFGASAGGHLAGSYCNSWNTDEVFSGIADDPKLIKPNACVLLYCASEIEEHEIMLRTMFGHGAPYSADELKRCVIRENVGPQTPPTVLFHPATDPMVPMQYSMELFLTLQKKGIPSELHIFGSGVHATGLGEGSAIEPWPELACRFLDNVFNNPEVFKPEYNRGSQANALFLAPPLRRLGDRFLQQTAHRLDEITRDHPEGFLPVHPTVAPPVEIAHAHNLLGRHKSALIQRKRKDRMALQHLKFKRNHPG